MKTIEKLSDAPLEEWVGVGTSSFFIRKDDIGFMLSLDPCETDPFKEGVYIGDDEITLLIEFLSEK